MWKKNDENLGLNFDSLEKYIIQNVGHPVKSWPKGHSRPFQATWPISEANSSAEYFSAIASVEKDGIKNFQLGGHGTS